MVATDEGRNATESKSQDVQRTQIKDPQGANEQSVSYEEKQVVVFKLANEEFGVNITDVKEIIRMDSITQIPNTASYVKGVINLRGGIIVVIDLAKKLGLPEKDTDSNTRIIVLEIADNTVGMIVDSATEVLRLRSDEIKDAPSIVKQKIDTDYIEGVGIVDERLLILLDLGKVIQSEDMGKIHEIEERTAPASIKETDTTGISDKGTTASQDQVNAGGEQAIQDGQDKETSADVSPSDAPAPASAEEESEAYATTDEAAAKDAGPSKEPASVSSASASASSSASKAPATKTKSPSDKQKERKKR
ncbi:MAG: chemotaxis protein CheW [Nanoarchaeota archaeon]